MSVKFFAQREHTPVFYYFASCLRSSSLVRSSTSVSGIMTLFLSGESTASFEEIQV